MIQSVLQCDYNAKARDQGKLREMSRVTVLGQSNGMPQITEELVHVT